MISIAGPVFLGYVKPDFTHNRFVIGTRYTLWVLNIYVGYPVKLKH